MQPKSKVEVNGGENNDVEDDEVESNDIEEPADPSRSISGDVIGNTAYSERFVLKILIKLANKDTLKDELHDQSFEDELCTLWDMTTEKDVVLYLQGHDVFNLFSFALPMVESTRIIEIIIGIIGNMCSHREFEIPETLIQNKDLMDILAEYLKSDDSQVLNQLLRLISSCLYLAEEDIEAWMTMFESVEYGDILYFILKNSTNKDLLVSALENFNTLAEKSCLEDYYDRFFRLFVKTEALDALYTGYREVLKHIDHEDDKSRMRVIAVQIIWNLLRFDEPPKIFSSNKQTAVKLLRDIIEYYEHNITLLERADIMDLFHILESADVILDVLKVSKINNPDKYFIPCYKMWKVATSVQCENLLNNYYKMLITPLSTVMCIYLSQCTDENFVKALDIIGNDHENIINNIKNDTLKSKTVTRTASHRDRLSENVDPQ